MHKVTAIVADDERLVRDELVAMLQRLWPELDILAVADNGAQAASLMTGLAPDVAFLDIRMPLKTGMAVSALAGRDCNVVFVTAYDDYAVQAFAHSAVDYLLKPVQESRLQQTIERLKMVLQKDKKESERHPADNCDNPEPVASNENLNWLRVSDGDAVVILGIGEVIYFRAGDKYTTVTTAGKSYLIRKPISELEQELDPELFWRIHRGIIVNVSHIAQVRKGLNGVRVLSLKGRKETLTASRRYRHLFDQM